MQLFSRWYLLHCQSIDKLGYNFPFKIKRGNLINTRDKLIGEYMYALKEAFYEIVQIYSYSVSANLIAEELEKNGDEGLANFWKYKIRNANYRNFIPRFYSILDYIAFMTYEISQGELWPNKKEREAKWVDFKEISEVLKEKNKINDDLGWLSLNDRKQLLIIFNKAFYGVTEYGNKVLERYRNIITHRYLPGIDEMTISTERNGTNTRVCDTGKIISFGDGKNRWEIYGGPEFQYSELIEGSKILLDNLYLMLNELSKLEVMKETVIIIKDDNIT